MGGSVTVGAGVSSTILSLTTDATGQIVVVSNGQASVLANLKQLSSVMPVALTIDGTTVSATNLPLGGTGSVVSGQTL